MLLVSYVSNLLQTPRILWFSFLNATVIMAVVAFIAKPDVQEPPALMLPILAGVALVSALLSIFMPRSQHRAALQRVQLRITEEIEPGGSDVLPYREQPKRRVFADPKDAERRAVRLFNTPFVLAMAFSESIATLGLALAMMGYPPTQAVPFFGVSALLVAVRFPTRNKVLRPLEKAQNAVFP